MKKDFLKYLTTVFAYLHFSIIENKAMIKHCIFAKNILKEELLNSQSKKKLFKLNKLQRIAIYLILGKYIMITNQEKKVSLEEKGELNVEIMQTYNFLVKKLPFYCRSQYSLLKSKRNELENVSIEEIFGRVKGKSILNLPKTQCKGR